MKRFVLLLVVLGCLAALRSANASDDWPIWRGPNGNNIAPGQQSPPTQWDEETNILWKTEVPGQGHSSPIIVGDQIFLSTADGETQSVLSFDRKTGAQQWQTTVNEGGLESRIHSNNTHASPTIVTHNNRMFVVFNNHRSVQLAALDFSGKLLWEKTTGSFVPKYPFGFGSSPCVYKDLVIVMSDYPRDGFLVAYNQADGQEVWRTKRGQTSSYATPIIANIDGRDQLVVSGTDVRSYDPKDGSELWNVDGPWQVTCGTPVWEGDTVFVSGGFPTPATIAVSTKNQEVIWKNQVKSYEQSMLVHDNHVYAHSDNGVAYCWRASDGQEMWKKRVSTRGVSASPVLVGDHIFMTAENGDTIVIKANPEKFELVQKNRLGGSAFATPSFVDNRIYTRVGTSKGSSPQYLYCIGKE